MYKRPVIYAHSFVVICFCRCYIESSSRNNNIEMYLNATEHITEQRPRIIRSLRVL